MGERGAKLSKDNKAGRWSRPKTVWGEAAPEALFSEIEALASRVLRLMVSHRDPERFFIERSDIAGEMRRLARAVR